MKIRLSIKNKLVMYFGLILVIGFGLYGFVANTIYKRMIEEQALKNLEYLVSDTAHKVNIIVDHKREEIEKLATMPTLIDQNLSVEEKLSSMTTVNEFLCFKDIALIDINGEVYSVSGQRGNIADFIGLEDTLNGKITFSPTIKLENETVFYIAMPLISNKGEIVGGVVVIDNTECFASVLTGDGMSDEFLIIDSKANIVTHSNEKFVNAYQSMDEMMPSSELAHVYQKMLIGEEGTGDYVNPKTGKQSYISYAPINIGWSIAIVKHSDEVLSDLRKSNDTLLGVAIIIIVIGLMLIYFVARKMTHPMSEITNYLSCVAHGELKQPISEKLLELEDEMGDAARALRVIKSEIEEMIETIKNSVDYMNEQMEDLTDGIKDELENLLASDEIDDEKRQDVIQRLNLLNQMAQEVSQLDSSNN